ncbi:tRNA-dihydrouridine synthase [Candidatus Kuenenia stuttgartiensis]|jgi:nifR3 family TIM-barrel protein|uniref:tRNA-dihydrouridine synthase n=2 Tax=Candidatus Brocadiaceae TaxID=1127830 RepID=Q1Q3Q8_KUEST|nr:tRNA dihydrouridine synthase DusB [Candidatus Kuenenia stuttgartiensis]QII11760.1 tRNA-dihydrouridine synthase [Candidatus Kuenenia stuttgartiensis]TVM00388.1 MAG: tRNA dihydrouridine synthase DusB [Candidatus Kuenenia stuttgartiensis]CAJ74653.1 strongly similar to tRNA-dihydrouridine synthase [Candidatus Kuenenia stuttgartiensis]SOH05997.1 strongly similar to tRNA-dihydrouridine synthase [Candidatus Kuenenia stuttgartiensis]
MGTIPIIFHRTKVLQFFCNMNPSFYIRNIPVYGELILAPMAGFSDMPYRLICRRFGMSMSYTEVVSVSGIVWNNKKTFKLLDFKEEERPVTFQVVGNDECQITEACKKIEQLGPDIIDINMGCSVSDIAGKGAGAGMLKHPSKISKMFNNLTGSLSVPVTGKIRLGWDHKTRNYIEVARILEENGASLIAVHGRTRSQYFSGAADWDAIAEVKQSVKIPVIANGDVRSVADIAEIKKRTACDGVMIGRAAIGHPWIFRYKDRENISGSEKIEMIRYHLDCMKEYYGHAIGVVLFRKHAVKYIVGLPKATELRPYIVRSKSAEDIISYIAAHLNRYSKYEAA